MVLALFLLLAGGWAAGPVCGEEPREPPVSRAEADLLNRVLDLAADDGTAAVAALQREITGGSSAVLHFALGNLHYAMEAWAQADEAYATAIAKWPAYRPAVTNLAQVRLLNSDPAGAVEVLAAYLEQDRDRSPELYRLLGQAHGAREDWVPAESAFRQVLMLRPGDREARAGLTRALLDQGRYAEAASLVKVLLAEDPTQTEWWSLRANLHLAEDRQDQAVAALESARLLGATTAEMLALLGDLYLNRGQARDAVRVYEQSFATAALSGERMLRMAEGFLYLDQREEAARWIARAEEALDDGPAASGLLRLRAELARHEGRMDEAREFYKELLEHEPLNGRALLSLADIERMRQQPDEAVMLVQRAARIAGFETRALTILARIEVDRGRYRSAIQALQRALEFEDRREIREYLERVRRLADAAAE